MWLLPVQCRSRRTRPSHCHSWSNRFASDSTRLPALNSGVEERRAKVEAIYAEARKKSQAWIEKAWDEKPISPARFFSEINKRVQKRSWALVRRTAGAGAKRSK